MARLILDTSVLIDAERGGNALAATVADSDDVAIAAVTVAELRLGVRLAKGKRREKRESFVASVLEAVSVETYDLEVADAHADLLAEARRTGTPRGPHDLIIAATAVVRRRQVVTLDRRGLADLPGVISLGHADSRRSAP